MDPSAVVDLATYPIDRLGSAEGQELVETCRRALEERALCLLPGFVTPTALSRMASQAEALAPLGHPSDNLRTPYGFLCNRGFPLDHPRSRQFRNRSTSVLADQVPPDSLTAALYRWDPLTDFVAAALGFERLHRCACPHHSLMITVMGEGDGFGWHFDTNDGVVSLLLQQPDSGGHFEYAPYIRSEDDEGYPAVEQLFAGAPGSSIRPDIAAGTFVLFKGRRSCHRVAPVGPTARPRMIALFSYDQRPDMVFPETTVRDYLSPSPEPYLGQSA